MVPPRDGREASGYQGPLSLLFIYTTLTCNSPVRLLQGWGTDAHGIFENCPDKWAHVPRSSAVPYSAPRRRQMFSHPLNDSSSINVRLRGGQLRSERFPFLTLSPTLETGLLGPLTLIPELPGGCLFPSQRLGSVWNYSRARVSSWLPGKPLISQASIEEGTPTRDKR